MICGSRYFALASRKLQLSKSPVSPDATCSTAE